MKQSGTKRPQHGDYFIGVDGKERQIADVLGRSTTRNATWIVEYVVRLSVVSTMIRKEAIEMRAPCWTAVAFSLEK